MRTTLSWLRAFAPLQGDADEIAALCNDLGMEVEGVERVGEVPEGVVVARVLALRPHPAADRIQLVDVDAGSGEPLQIGCGAFNMAVGDLVPLATTGTVMPNGLKIERRKLRGEWSNGMLCSSAELGLSDDAAGIRILPPDVAPPGTPLAEALGVTPDAVLDLSINPNRPDALAVVGVARDLAARQRVPFTPPDPKPVPASGVPATERLKVEIVNPDRCGRFAVAVLEGVRVGPSPAWMAERLLHAGMRPINNVVDVSNLVMLELGQPNHAYDLATLQGGGFRIRLSRAGERIVTLDGVERVLHDEDLLICDGVDRPVGVAGIMGGANTEISEQTTAVALELAWFDPMTIARAAKRLGLRSEASARFERGVDWEVIPLAAARFAELLAETCPDLTVAPGLVDERGRLPERAPVRLRLDRVASIVGVELDAEQVRALLDPIGFTTRAEGADLLVDLPTWRYDATTEIDVIEEVARHHGYSRIPPRVPRSAHPGGLTPFQQERRRVRAVMVGEGLLEAQPDPFLAPGDLERAGLPGAAVRIANPLVAEESLLRTSLLPGLLQAIAYNASHRRTGVGLFEVGHVYGVPPEDQLLPDERELVAAALAGRDARAARRLWDVLALTLGVVGVEVLAAEVPGLHATRSAELRGPGGEAVGVVGEVDPGVLAAHAIAERVAWLSVDLEILHGLPRLDRKARPVSRFPSSDIDLAFVVDEATPAAAVERTLRSAGGELLVELELFDVYRGPGVPSGTRSLAYSLRLQSAERTLTDADVADVRQRCIAAVEAALPAKLRGA